MCRVTWRVGKRPFKSGETVALAPIDILHVPGAKIYPSFTKPTRHFSDSACDMYNGDVGRENTGENCSRRVAPGDVQIAS